MQTRPQVNSTLVRNRLQNSSKSLPNGIKIGPKSIQNRSWRGLARLGTVLDGPWGVSAPSRSRFGASWGRLGASRGDLGASWGRPGGVLGTSWERPGGVLGHLRKFIRKSMPKSIKKLQKKTKINPKSSPERSHFASHSASYFALNLQKNSKT